MNLFALTTSFPNNDRDYAGRFVAEWAQSMVSQGDHVRVLTPPGDYTPDGLTRLTYMSPGPLLSGSGAPEYLKKRPLLGALSGGVATTGMLWRAVSEVQSDEIFVAHWLIPSALAALAAGRRLCTPVHGYAHGSDIALLERVGGRVLARLIDDKIMGITFVSEDLKERYLACVGRPSKASLTVIPMGISRAQPCLQYGQEIRDIAQGRRVITTVGRLVPIKGLDVLTDALTSVENYVWCAAGDGPELPNLRRRAEQLGVQFMPLGRISPQEREALLAESHVFVQPSRCLDGRREGTPLAVVEAISAGVPTVGTATGGLVELAQQTGMVQVEPEDIVGLTESIRQLLDDDTLRARLTRQHALYGERQTWAHLGKTHRAAIQATAERFSCVSP